MTRLMLDGDSHNIPAAWPIVAGYVTDDVAWSAQDWARFHGEKVRINQQPNSITPCDVFDCEPGAWEVSAALSAAAGQGGPKVLYLPAEWLQDARQQVQRHGMGDRIRFWVANWNLTLAEAEALLGGDIIAIQFASPLSNPDLAVAGGTLKSLNLDLSVVADDVWNSTPALAPRVERRAPRSIHTHGVARSVPRAPIHPKVQAAGLAGALTTLLVALLHTANVTATPAELAAATTAISTVAAYLTPAR